MNKQEKTEEFEVQVTNLPETDNTRISSSWRFSRAFLSWQRSVTRRSWRISMISGILVLSLVALLIIMNGLRGNPTPPSVTSTYIRHAAPPHYIYRNQPAAEYLGHRSSDGTVQIWNAQTGKRLLTCRSETVSVAWSPDGSLIASAGDDGIVKAWQVA